MKQSYMFKAYLAVLKMVFQEPQDTMFGENETLLCSNKYTSSQIPSRGCVLSSILDVLCSAPTHILLCRRYTGTESKDYFLNTQNLTFNAHVIRNVCKH